MTEAQTKMCKRCGQEKPATIQYFPPHSLTKNGCGPYCRPCQNEYGRGWKRKHSQRLAAVRRERYAATHGEEHKRRELARALRQPLATSARRLIEGVRQRSKDKGLPVWPMLRSKQFVINWLVAQPKCPCCGVEFALGNFGKRGCYLPNSPSFDQYEIGKGYVEGNVELICMRCNMIKRDYSEADLRRVADWMRARSNETDKFTEAVA